jgi:hypothetical protein
LSEETPKMGRPTIIDQVDLVQVTELYAKGYTNDQVSKMLGINRTTLYNWQSKHKNFKDAIRRGKELADDLIEEALYSRAKGMKIEETKVFCHEGLITTEVIDKHLAPDVNAAKFWLNNRRADRWKDKKEIEQSGDLTLIIGNDDEDI